MAVATVLYICALNDHSTHLKRIWPWSHSISISFSWSVPNLVWICPWSKQLLISCWICIWSLVWIRIYGLARLIAMKFRSTGLQTSTFHAIIEWPKNPGTTFPAWERHNGFQPAQTKLQPLIMIQVYFIEAVRENLLVIPQVNMKVAVCEGKCNCCNQNYIGADVCRPLFTSNDVCITWLKCMDMYCICIWIERTTAF